MRRWVTMLSIACLAACDDEKPVGDADSRRVGDIDGNGRSAIGILGVDWGEAVEVRVVDGGLCGVVEIEDVSVLLDEPA